MNVEPMQLNVREGTKPFVCFSCRPTPAHYRETGRKLVQNLPDQHIIERCADSRSKRWRNLEEYLWHSVLWWISLS